MVEGEGGAAGDEEQRLGEGLQREGGAVEQAGEQGRGQRRGGPVVREGEEAGHEARQLGCVEERQVCGAQQRGLAGLQEGGRGEAGCVGEDSQEDVQVSALDPRRRSHPGMHRQQGGNAQRPVQQLEAAQDGHDVAGAGGVEMDREELLNQVREIVRKRRL